MKAFLYPSDASMPFVVMINKYSSNPGNKSCLIPYHNNTPTLTPDRIFNNPESINIKEFSNTFDIYCIYLLFKPSTLYLVGITIVSLSIVKND